MALDLLRGSPRQGELYELFARAGANVATATGLLVELLRRGAPAPFPGSDAHELISEIDDDGDRVVRGAIASLFEGGIDPMVVIRWKDVNERLEAAIDVGGHVGNALEGLMVRDVEGR